MRCNLFKDFLGMSNFKDHEMSFKRQIYNLHELNLTSTEVLIYRTIWKGNRTSLNGFWSSSYFNGRVFIFKELSSIFGIAIAHFCTQSVFFFIKLGYIIEACNVFKRSIQLTLVWPAVGNNMDCSLQHCMLYSQVTGVLFKKIELYFD